MTGTPVAEDLRDPLSRPPDDRRDVVAAAVIEPVDTRRADASGSGVFAARIVTGSDFWEGVPSEVA